jgi:ribosomal protein S12 methylthiotransferase accessory factor
LGLYAPDQYDAPGFPFARYSPNALLEWVQITEAVSRESRYIPAEFIYPRAAVARIPLVAETSSGTAAHHSRDAALLAAVCEVIERDSLLMFWHRRPPTMSFSIDSSVSVEAAGDLEKIRSMGFLTVVCLLQYDLGIPCVLALALRGDRFAYGAGCRPILKDAAEHAVRELGNLVRWQVLQGGGPGRLVDLSQVKKPSDHYALYDGGAYHGSLRQLLDVTIRPAAPPVDASRPTKRPNVVEWIHDRGYRIFECDITPAEIGSSRAVVTRVFVPGLIPMYFGYDRIRLGCRRLWSRDRPGRFSSLLPHFMA